MRAAETAFHELLAKDRATEMRLLWKEIGVAVLLGLLMIIYLAFA